MKRLILTLIVIILAIGAIWYFAFRSPAQPTQAALRFVASATYACAAGKTIDASFYEGSSTPGTAGNPPIPGGSVTIALSDGRSLTLPQTISADGARYADPAETTVFWSKGNGATFTENGQNSYPGCITIVKDPGGLPQAYSNGSQGFSIRLPAGYTPDESYRYQALGPKTVIGGVKFTIASSTAAGTNLSSDSYISVEEIAQAPNCSAALFVSPGTRIATTTEGNTTYSVATSSDAGAGNRYDETVYALPGSNPCIAVRYFIHYGAIGNYPQGSVTEFDEPALLNLFDQIRRTLTIL